MKPLFFRILLACNFILLSFCLSAKAHSNSLDMCEDLQKIIANSTNGFNNAANLQFSDFNKPGMVVTLDFPVFSGKIVKNAIVYQTYKSLSDAEAAKRLYFAAFINTQSCLQNASFDNTTPSGYISYSKFLVKDKVNNSEVTVYLNLRQAAKDQYMITLYIVQAQSANVSGNNSSSQIENTLVPKNENTIIAGHGCNKIFIGTTRSEIEAQLGKPEAGGDNYSTYYEKGLVVNYDTTQRVKVIRFIGDAANYSGGKTNFRSFVGKPDKNLSWGTSRQQVISAYGTPVKQDSFNDVAEVIYNDIEFNFKNDRLTVIAVKVGAAQNSTVNNSTPQNNIPSKPIDVCQFIKILSDSAKNNFALLKGEEIPKYSDDWFMLEKKFKAKIVFSEFEFAQIEKDKNREANYYSAKMTFEESRMVPFVMKQTVEQIKRCTNLNLTPDSDSSKELYDFRIENQTHSDGFKYVYLVRLQWGEPAVSNSRNLYFKLIPLRQN